MNISRSPSLDPSNFMEGERVFDPKHPENSVIKITVETNSRVSGSHHLSRLMTEMMLNQGYANVHYKNGTDLGHVTFDNFQVATLYGVDPDLKDLQKKVTIKVEVLAPRSKDFDLSYLEAMDALINHGQRIGRKKWDDEERAEPMKFYAVHSRFVSDKEFNTWSWHPTHTRSWAERDRKNGKETIYSVAVANGGLILPGYYTATGEDMLANDWYIVK